MKSKHCLFFTSCEPGHFIQVNALRAHCLSKENVILVSTKHRESEENLSPFGANPAPTSELP